MKFRHLSSCLSTFAAALVALAGCNQTVALPPMPTTGSGVGAASTSGAGSGSGSTGTSATGTSGGSSGQGTSGTTGGTTGTLPAFVDGGFVFCTVPNPADGGSANWLCPPGTYFCNPESTGSCLQCRSDADCRDRNLPTYDPRRLRCDLRSDITGYQDFCQQCLGNADCDGNAAGGICDVNPTYPLNGNSDVPPPGSSLEPPIETLGFETCQTFQVDCRLDGGPDCQALDEVCDPARGICEREICGTDADCVGQLLPVGTATGLAAILSPFCVNGTCDPCDGGICPNEYCAYDLQCGNPDSAPDKQSCDTTTNLCACTSSAQCSGFFPVCTGLDGGGPGDAGQPMGYCGCTSDADCGDGGLTCLPGSYESGVNAGFCGVLCTAPGFPSCVSFERESVCDPASGLCSACTTDSECARDPYAGGSRCSSEELDMSGPCGCLSNSDCPAGWSCDAPGPFSSGSYFQLGACTPAMSRCTPNSCDGYFCNWEDGGCVNTVDLGSVPSCLANYDCGPGAFCVSGACAECRTDLDCRALGQAGLEAISATYCCQAGNPSCPNSNICLEQCGSDADCVGNPNGTGCTSNYNTTQCGCHSDQNCAGVANAPRCDLQSPDAPGTCECGTSADCPAGQTCQNDGEAHSACTSSCTTDSDCASGFFCHPSGSCYPRCDPGHSCQAPDPVCDVGNAVGDNGQPDAGTIWCYPCLTGNDCAGGLACEVALYPPSCGTCKGGLGDCGSGDCLSILDGLCHQTCESGPCPSGQVCDTANLLHILPNLCYGCVTAADCPNGQGCDRITHTCGTCEGPTAAGAPSDCPPDAVCSNYWGGQSGVCLQNCDRAVCPDNRPLCETFPSLTPDHAYCFGCLTGSDCADAGPGATCDTSISLTFTCLSH